MTTVIASPRRSLDPAAGDCSMIGLGRQRREAAFSATSHFEPLGGGAALGHAQLQPDELRDGDLRNAAHVRARRQRARTSTPTATAAATGDPRRGRAAAESADGRSERDRSRRPAEGPRRSSDVVSDSVMMTSVYTMRASIAPCRRPPMVRILHGSTIPNTSTRRPTDRTVRNPDANVRLSLHSLRRTTSRCHVRCAPPERSAAPRVAPPAVKIFAPVSVAFKGTGFHNTDYRAKPVDTSSDAPKAEPACPAATERPHRLRQLPGRATE